MHKPRSMREAWSPSVALVGALLLGMPACAGDAPISTATVTDSAGITIVTNPHESLESAGTWSLSWEPVVEIGGGADPSTPLLQVTDVAPRPDGGVIVGMNSPPQVLAFDSDGGLVTTIGRQGEGPGEFSSVVSVVPMPGDSIAAWDPARRLISVFGGDGRFARQVDLGALVPIPASEAVGTDSTSGFTSLLESRAGSLVVFGEGAVTSAPEPTVLRPEMSTYRIRTDGEVVATIGSIPGMEVLVGSPQSPLPVPFGARTYAASSRGDLVIGTAAGTEFRVYGPTGDLERMVRWPDAPREVSGRPLTTWSTMVSEWAADQPYLRDLVESVPRAERLPAYQDLVTNERGDVMVGEYPGPLGVWPMRRGEDGPDLLRPMIRMPARRWLIFDSTGASTATLATPEGFEPYAARDGRLWGVFSDELDVESVRAYDVIRP